MSDNIYKRLDSDQVQYLVNLIFTKLKSSPLSNDTNTTYTLTQDSTDGHKLTFTGSDGKTATVTIPDANTTYSVATTNAAGLMSAAMLSKLNGIAEGANKTTVDSAMSSSSTNPVQNKVVNSALGAKANTASPTFTGTPSAPTAGAGTNSTQIATTAFVQTAVSNAVADAVAGITQFQFSVVDSLPTTGTVGIIYLVKHSHTTGDGYDEYIWLGDTLKYEKLGNTDMDLSGYVKASQMSAMTNTEIQSAVDSAYSDVFG